MDIVVPGAGAAGTRRDGGPMGHAAHGTALLSRGTDVVLPWY